MGNSIATPPLARTEWMWYPYHVNASELWNLSSGFLFLIGVVLLYGSVVPSVRQRYPASMKHGFLAVLAALGMVFGGHWLFA
jgi:hypothetical protein